MDMIGFISDVLCFGWALYMSHLGIRFLLTEQYIVFLGIFLGHVRDCLI